MAHPKNNELIPLKTVVRIKDGFNKGKRAIIMRHMFLMDERGFMNYMGRIEGRDGSFALYHDNLDIMV